MIPCVNAFDVDQNLLNKMFPLTFLSGEWDERRTCCSKFNSGFCNLKHLAFDRKCVCTLDGWLVEMLECVIGSDKSRKFPTCHFEKQQLTDVMCTLLYLIDLYLDGRSVNLFYKEKLFMKYKDLFTLEQQAILLEMLIRFNKSENDKLFGLGAGRTVCVDLIKQSIGEYKWYDDNLIVPIQNVSSDWMLGAGISKYSTKIFVDSLHQFKACKSKVTGEAIVCFGFTDSIVHEFKYCIYNKFDLVDDFDEWCFEFFQFENVSSKNIKIPRTNNLQDYLIVLEMALLRVKYRKFISNLKKIEIWSYNKFGLCMWPFDLRIFSAYVLFYVLFYKIFNKKRVVDFDAIILCHAWNGMIKNRKLSHYEVNFSLLKKPIDIVFT
jgi:hypothetical protein